METPVKHYDLVVIGTGSAASVEEEEADLYRPFGGVLIKQM